MALASFLRSLAPHAVNAIGAGLKNALEGKHSSAGDFVRDVALNAVTQVAEPTTRNQLVQDHINRVATHRLNEEPLTRHHTLFSVNGHKAQNHEQGKSQKYYDTEKAYIMRNAYRRAKGKGKIRREDFKPITAERYQKYKKGRSIVDNIRTGEVNIM